MYGIVLGRMSANVTSVYRPRQPEKTILYKVVQETLETLLATCEQAGSPLPSFVEREFRQYLSCGILSEGFTRVRCPACGFERLVPFSCKGTSLCPSCTGRQMAETAAHLVDNVIPRVPIRQWVLTLPPPLRYLLAYNSELIGEVLSAFLRSVFDWLRSKAQEELGLESTDGFQPGAVTAIQRAGSAINLNVHFHSLVTDGVFVQSSPEEEPVFHSLPAPTDIEIRDVAQATCERTVEILRQRGMWFDADPQDDRFAHEEPGLSALSKASIAGTIALGERAGQKVMRVIGQCANEDRYAAPLPMLGFNLHASRRVHANDRMGLERLCRYILRGPISNDSLSRLPNGMLKLRLTHPWSDGTMSLLMTSLELMEKLAVLVWPPGFHRIRYHGVFAAHATLRPLIVLNREGQKGQGQQCDHVEAANGGAAPNMSWSELLKRVFGYDIFRCPLCGERMQRISVITQPDVIRAILECVGMPADSPRVHPSKVAIQLDLAL
jgi:hypothetical protein